MSMELSFMKDHFFKEKVKEIHFFGMELIISFIIEIEDYFIRMVINTIVYTNSVIAIVTADIIIIKAKMVIMVVIRVFKVITSNEFIIITMKLN